MASLLEKIVYVPIIIRKSEKSHIIDLQCSTGTKVRVYWKNKANVYCKNGSLVSVYCNNIIILQCTVIIVVMCQDLCKFKYIIKGYSLILFHKTIYFTCIICSSL